MDTGCLLYFLATDYSVLATDECSGGDSNPHQIALEANRLPIASPERRLLMLETSAPEGTRTPKNSYLKRARLPSCATGAKATDKAADRSKALPPRDEIVGMGKVYQMSSTFGTCRFILLRV